MGNQHPGPLDVEQVDFDALYRGDAGFDGAAPGVDRVPWDIEEPQPQVVELDDAGRIRGAVLDVGCGLGDNALYLARQGHLVTGVDASPTALEQARHRARESGVDVTFVVDDVTRLEAVEPGFDTVLDSALYHCLGQQQRREYSAALHRVTRPGAALHLFCFADEGPGHFPAPFQVSPADLRTNLAAEWEISSVELVRYTIRYSPADLERMNAEDADTGIDPNEIEADDSGRGQVPMWRLFARRR